MPSSPATPGAGLRGPQGATGPQGPSGPPLADEDYGDITVSGMGTALSIADGAVDAAALATDAVETVKIKNANVTADKLATGSVTSGKLGTGAVGNTALASQAVTMVKIEDFSQNDILGRSTTGDGPPAKLQPSAVRTMLGISGVGSGSIITGTERTKIGYITVTQAVDLDAMETGISSNVTAVGAAQSTANNAASSASDAQDDADTANATALLLDKHTGRTLASLGLNGDGETDDTSALQTLLTAGGTIHLPAGNFLITWTSSATFGVNMSQAGTRLIGAGIGKTFLDIAIGTPSTTTTSGLRVAAPNCVIEGMTIQQTTLPARDRVEHVVRLISTATQCTLRDLDILGTVEGEDYNAYPTPVSHIEGEQGGTIGLYLDQADGAHISHVRCNDFAAGQLWNSGGAFGLQVESCVNVSVYKSTFNGNFFDGIKITDSAARGKNILFVDCVLNGNGLVVPKGLTNPADGVSLGNGNGIDIDASHVNMINCWSEGNYAANFQIKNGTGSVVHSHVVLESCTSKGALTVGSINQPGFSVFTDNGKYVTGTGSAKVIHHVILSNCSAIQNSGHGFDINVGTECQIRGGVSRSNGDYGVRLGKETARCEVSGVQILGNGTNGSSSAYIMFVDDGINHKIHDNHGSGIDSHLNADATQTEYLANTKVTHQGYAFRQTLAGHSRHYVYNNTIELIVNGSSPDRRFWLVSEAAETCKVTFWSNYEMGSDTPITDFTS